MSKELTPLEAFERIKNTPTQDIYFPTVKYFHPDCCDIVEEELKAFNLLLSYGISYNDLREIIITLVCGYDIKTMEDLMSLLSIGELNNG